LIPNTGRTLRPVQSFFVPPDPDEWPDPDPWLEEDEDAEEE
jgi:hypothetical protein